MPVRQKGFIAAALLFLVCAPFALENITIVIPGWHVSTNEEGGLYHYFLPVWFVLISLFYKEALIRNRKVSTCFFITHLVVSVITLLIIYFLPLTLFAGNSFEPATFIKQMKFIRWLWYFFIAGQLFCASVLMIKIFRQQPD